MMAAPGGRKREEDRVCTEPPLCKCNPERAGGCSFSGGTKNPFFPCGTRARDAVYDLGSAFENMPRRWSTPSPQRRPERRQEPSRCPSGPKVAEKGTTSFVSRVSARETPGRARREEPPHTKAGCTHSTPNGEAGGQRARAVFTALTRLQVAQGRGRRVAAAAT